MLRQRNQGLGVKQLHRQFLSHCKHKSFSGQYMQKFMRACEKGCLTAWDQESVRGFTELKGLYLDRNVYYFPVGCGALKTENQVSFCELISQWLEGYHSKCPSVCRGTDSHQIYIDKYVQCRNHPCQPKGEICCLPHTSPSMYFLACVTFKIVLN